MSSFDIESVKIKEIVIRKAAIENKTDLIELDKNQYPHSLTYTFEAGINLNSKRVRIVFFCDIRTQTKDKADVEISGNFEIAYIFTVDNLRELATTTTVTNENENEMELNINEYLVLNLSNIVYATSRGVIYSRCQGTILKNVLLPILPTKQLAEMISKSAI